MGKPLRQQIRGKGTPAYRAPSHRFFGDINYEPPSKEEREGAIRGQVVEFIDDPARSVLIAKILLEDGRTVYNLAVECIGIGDFIWIGRDSPPKVGCIMPLKTIPDGLPIYNIESLPGDGGKTARTTGACAYVVAHDEETGLVKVRLPSKEVISLSPECRATIGVAAGGGRTEKPFMKAGAKMLAMAARNKYYPIVRGTAMSAYDHPHGGKSLGKPSTVSRHTPPGRKVGHVAAASTGRKKGKAKAVVEGGGPPSKRMR
ncbi:50S ribosomal protein L2 [Candidatus Micrarchaeota archaeon]|nr:50S ribosomal protein L2 [Candidatus Micrarchaeota archaeon]